MSAGHGWRVHFHIVDRWIPQSVLVAIREVYGPIGTVEVLRIYPNATCTECGTTLRGVNDG